jgi:hypothetical protein
MMADEVRPAGAARRGYWLPLTLGGLLIAGAVPLYAWVSGWDRLHTGISVTLVPLTRTAYFPPPTTWFVQGGVPYGPVFYYLGWYWAVALMTGYLLAVLWYRRQASPSGRAAPARRYLVAAVVLIALAIVLPALTQAVPSLSALWLGGPWVKGIPVLLIIGCALGVVARLERNRRLARLAVLYAVAALLASGFLARMPDEQLLWGPAVGGWPAFLAPLAALLLPAAVLIAAGLAALATQGSAAPS